MRDNDGWVVMLGHLGRGVEAIEEPFPTEVEARDYASDQREYFDGSDQQWVVMPLYPPSWKKE